MSHFAILFAALRASGTIDEEETRRLVAADLRQEAGRFVQNDPRLREKFETAARDFDLVSKIGAEALHQLLTIVSSDESFLGPGVTTRWPKNDDVLPDDDQWVAKPTADEIQQFAKETEEKIWAYKKEIHRQRIAAFSALESLARKNEVIRPDSYKEILQPLMSLVRRGVDELQQRDRLVKINKAPGGEEIGRLKHDFNANPCAILLLNDSRTLSQLKAGETPDFSWLIPPRDLGSLLYMLEKFSIPMEGRKEVLVEVSIPEDLKFLRMRNEGCLEDLSRIVTNLVTNGVKYVNEDLSEERRYVRVSARVDEAQLIFVVEDNGRGMSRDFVETKYGKTGMRADEVKEAGIEGTGYGAANVVDLTQSLGGAFKVESELGKGTRITISLPLTLFEEDDKSNNRSGGALGSTLSLDMGQVGKFVGEGLRESRGEKKVERAREGDPMASAAPLLVESAEPENLDAPLFQIVGASTVDAARPLFTIIGAEDSTVVGISLVPDAVDQALPQAPIRAPFSFVGARPTAMMRNSLFMVVR